MFLSFLLTGMSFAALKDLQSGGGLNVQSISEEVHRHSDTGAVHVEADGSIHMMSDANAPSNQYQDPPFTMKEENRIMCSGGVGNEHAPLDLKKKDPKTREMVPTGQLTKANHYCHEAGTEGECAQKPPKKAKDKNQKRHNYVCVWMSAIPGGDARCKPCFSALKLDGNTHEEFEDEEVQHFAEAQGVLQHAKESGKVTEDMNALLSSLDAKVQGSPEESAGKPAPQRCAEYRDSWRQFHLLCMCLAYHLASDIFQTHISPRIGQAPRIS